MCFLGVFCSESKSQSSNATNIDNSVTDNRVGLDNNSTYVGAGATITSNTDSHNSVDSHEITDSHNITYVTDNGTVAAATEISKAGLDTAAIISGGALKMAGTTSETAIKAAQAAAEASATASARTAQSAIDAITRSSADSNALARSLGSDAIQFGHDVATGFINSSSDLNKLVGTLSGNNDQFLTTATDKILARSQSADQQNFEATLNMLKWIAAAAALAFVVPRMIKA
jgi:hypothetical protein